MEPGCFHENGELSSAAQNLRIQKYSAPFSPTIKERVELATYIRNHKGNVIVRYSSIASEDVG
jgi:N-methylhydantoinase B/oxoprolinase/acetone carboxylase alpha subunit